MFIPVENKQKTSNSLDSPPPPSILNQVLLVGQTAVIDSFYVSNGEFVPWSKLNIF